MLTYFIYTGIFLILMIMIFMYIKYGRNAHSEQSALLQAEQTLAQFDQEIDAILNNPNLSESEKQQRADECIHRYGMNSHQ